MTRQKIICIGLNHAGVSAVKTLIYKRPDMEITGYEQDNKIAFLSCGIALWIKKQVSNTDDLFQSNEAELKKLNINVKLSHQVIKIDSAHKRVQVKNLLNNDCFWDYYDKLIVSTGSRLCVPCFPGVDLKGVFAVKNFEEGKTLINFLNHDQVRKVAVIGTGYVGIEFAEAFFDNRKEVSMFDIAPRVMNNYFEQEFTSPIEQAIKERKINLFLKTCILSFKGQNKKVQTIVTDKGEFTTDMVVMCVGMLPNTLLLKGIVDLSCDQYVMVNQFFQTSNPDIYACGDCIKVIDNSCQQERNIGLASNSVRTGINLALNLATNHEYPFLGVQATSAVNIFGWKVMSTGINGQNAQKLKLPYKTVFFEDFSRPVFMESKRVKIKLCWDPKTLFILGCQIASQEDHSEAIYFFSLAIMKKLKINELPMVDLFFLPHFNKPDNFITQVGLRAMNIELEGV